MNQNDDNMPTLNDKQLFAKKSSPLVSIILVNYNGLKWFQLCLHSLLDTDYPEFEILVIDNASTDGSVDYLKRNYSDRIKLIKLNENLGFCEGCNIGFRESRGDIIALLNTDVQVDNKWLRSAVGKLQSRENVGSVQSKMMQYANKRVIDCAGLSVDSHGLVAKIGEGEIDHGQYDGLPEIWASSGGAMIIWRHILAKVGLFDPTYFLYYDDIDLAWRIRLLGYKNLLDPSSIVYHMGSATTRTFPSSFIIFHSTKNNISSWLKNYSVGSLIAKMPMLSALVIGSLILELLHRRFGHFKARVKSIIWVLRSINYILNERHKVQHLIRRVSDSMVFTNEGYNSLSNVRHVRKLNSGYCRS
jgi:GT2 family glycosyltransferase